MQREGPGKKTPGDEPTASRDQGVMENYQVGCPDELAIVVTGKSGFTTRKIVGPDGRIELGKYGNPRVEGRSPDQIAALLAADLDVTQGSIQVRVSEYRSRQLFLFGPKAGWQQSLPYRGQETVLELLQRADALSPGKDTGDVYVVRAHIAEGGRPEVFHVDLKAILGRHDQNTNLAAAAQRPNLRQVDPHAPREENLSRGA